MLRLRAVTNSFRQLQRVCFASDAPTSVDTTYMEIPVYDINKPQTLETRKARLQYQSRKRGMLENGLLLSTFAAKYLDSFDENQTMLYDRLINSPTNDWDIFYWIVEKQPTPKEFDNEIMDLLKKHAKNKDKIALSQPPLYTN